MGAGGAVMGLWWEAIRSDAFIPPHTFSFPCPSLPTLHLLILRTLDAASYAEISTVDVERWGGRVAEAEAEAEGALRPPLLPGHWSRSALPLGPDINVLWAPTAPSILIPPAVAFPCLPSPPLRSVLDIAVEPTDWMLCLATLDVADTAAMSSTVRMYEVGRRRKGQGDSDDDDDEDDDGAEEEEEEDEEEEVSALREGGGGGGGGGGRGGGGECTQRGGQGRRRRRTTCARVDRGACIL